MSSDEEHERLLPEEDTEAQLDSEEPPPAYEAAVWSKSQPLGLADVPELTSVATSSASEDVPAYVSTPPSSSFPATHMTAGPRRLTIPRDANGFGFTIGGGASVGPTAPISPAYVVQVDRGSSAYQQGLRPHDDILEINGVDVMRSGMQQVASMIAQSQQSLSLVVVAGATDRHTSQQNHTQWREALASDASQVIDTSAAPPTHCCLSSFSVLFCPLVGLAALYHSLHVRQAWRSGEARKSFLHSTMAKKLSSMAFFYGFLLILLYLFMDTDV